jgi:hypothetical protein
MERVERRPVAEMAGEALRESGVLVLVFGLLDEAVGDRPLRVLWVGAILSIGVILFVLGLWIERSRS